MEQANLASNKEGGKGSLCRIPRGVPSHEVPIAVALVVGPLTEHCEGDVTGVEIGQFTDVAGDPSATFALLRCWVIGMPHEVVGEQHPATIECVEQPHLAVGADQGCHAVNFHHGQPTACGGDGVALVSVCLFSGPQCIPVSYTHLTLP